MSRRDRELIDRNARVPVAKPVVEKRAGKWRIREPGELKPRDVDEAPQALSPGRSAKGERPSLPVERASSVRLL